MKNFKKHLAVILILVSTLVTNATHVFAGDYFASVFVILNDGSPITTEQTIRLSLWRDGRMEDSDIASGVINTSADNYADYQVEITRTPDSLGRLRIALSPLTDFPDMNHLNQFLMIEYKDSGDPVTSYTLYEDSYITGSTLDRYPLVEDGPEIFDGIYKNDATTADIFMLDQDDSSIDFTAIQFGTTGEQIAWDIVDNQFEISEDISLGLNELKDLVLEQLTSAPSTPVIGQMYYNTTTGSAYVYDGSEWENSSGGDMDTTYDNDTDQILNIDNTNGLEFESTVAGDIIVDLQSTGSFILQDAGSTYATFTDTGEFQIDNLQLDANNITSTNTDGNIIVDPDGNGVVNLVANVNIDGETVTLDYDNSEGDITLQFGQTLAETIHWDSANTRFTFSDDLRIEGNNSIIGQLYVADDHSATDSDGTINIGLNGSTWQTLSFDYTNDEFDISNDLDFGQNELRGAVMENLASAPSTPIVGQMYYNTTDNQTYMYANTGWEAMGYHAHTHVNGEDDIQLATSTQKGLMSPEYALELENLAGESDEINRNTIDHDLTLGENVISGTAYLTYENPDDVSFVANIENIEFTILNNTSPGIALTGGTDVNPTLNYIYVKDTGVVEASTVNPETQAFDWVPIAEVLVGTVSPTSATYYYIENLTNFIRNFIKDVNNRLREDYTIWLNGINPSTSGLDIAVTSGEVMHIHETNIFPAQNTATGDTMIDEYYNSYTQLDNTNYDNGAGGNTIIGNNKFHKVFIWGDVYGGLHMSRQRKPTSSEYTSFEQAVSDPDHVAINSIPVEWEYVGFPIAHIILNEALGVVEIIDLRSGGVAGGGGGGSHAQNTDTGTDSDNFTLDTDNTATDMSLIFGSTLNETLTWDGTNTRFTFSDDLRIEGNNSVLGELYVAGDHTATDSDGIFNLGRNGNTWENIMWDDSDDQFEISDDLSFGQNQLKNVAIDNLATAPATPVTGQIYYNTTDNNTYIYNGTSWEDVTATGSGSSSSDGWHGSTTRIKITPADFQSDDPDDNMYMSANGSYIRETGTASPVATMAIPTGYRATHINIYGSDTGNAVNVYVNEIDDETTATSLGTGNIGTEIDIIDTDSTALNYISIYINVGNNDEIYGGYITITPIP